MKKLFLLSLVAGILLPMLILTSCKKDDKKESLKVGLVLGIGSLDDKGFNQQAYEGLLAAAEEISIAWEVRESGSEEDLISNINYFTCKGVDVVITLGFQVAQPTLDAAYSFPGIKFLLLDYSFPDLPANMACVTFQVDQASFPCGFLAAYQALSKNPLNPVAGYVAGPDYPGIRQFTKSYSAGVAYFNSLYGQNVTVKGANAGNFDDTLRGAQLADSLMQLETEVIFACAGKTGNGALYKVLEKGKTAIGVDTDQHESIPQVGSVLLTSCMKHLNEAVINEIKLISCGEYSGGQTINYNLINKGVGLAPYHDFETLIPDSIKQAVLDIRQGIINGTIGTGW